MKTSLDDLGRRLSSWPLVRHLRHFAAGVWRPSTMPRTPVTPRASQPAGAPRPFVAAGRMPRTPSVVTVRPAARCEPATSPYAAQPTRWGVDGGYVPPAPPPPPEPPIASPRAVAAGSGRTTESESTSEEAKFETIVFRVFD
ncbi:MAG: hypothetical protein AAGC60_20320 [Acidobacteriota bacterium]